MNARVLGRRRFPLASCTARVRQVFSENSGSGPPAGAKGGQPSVGSGGRRVQIFHGAQVGNHL